MLTRSSSAAQRGFTLVEALVAMVLLAIALGAVAPALVETSKSGARSASSAATQGARSTALSLLESDLRAMRGPLRGYGDDHVEGSNIVEQLGQNTNSLPGAPAGYGVPSSHDIVFAGPRMLEFWADVMDVGGSAVPDERVELVRWYLVTEEPASCGGNASWCVVRDVRYGDGAGQVVSEVVSSGRGAIPRGTGCSEAHGGTEVRLFCYNQRVVTGYYNWDFSPTCTDSWVPVPPSYNPNAKDVNAQVDPRRPSRGEEQRGVSITNDSFRFVVQHSQGTAHWLHSLDRVSTVGIVLPTAAAIGKGDDVMLTTSKVEIRSRQSSEYQAAILCGAR